MQKVVFGTDGIRNIVNENLMPEVAYKVGASLAVFLCKTKANSKVLISKDTRNTGDMLFCSICAGLLSHGVECEYMQESTTPALAYLTKKNKYDAGVIITASHNNASYNGIKIFDGGGLKLNEKSVMEIEQIAEELSYSNLVPFNQVKSLTINKKLIETYIAYLKSNLQNCNFKIVFDCANGATYNIVKKIFPHAKIIGGEIYKQKENENCGATHIEYLKNYVQAHNFDIGFSFDGDGDRVLIVLKDGTILDGDDILYILTKYYLENKMLRKKEVVGTIITNIGVEQALNELGIKLNRQNVGDKFISAEMNKKSLQIGAEQSGHIILERECLTGDGIFISIKILEIMQKVGSLKNYISKVKKYLQLNENVSVPEKMKEYIMSSVEFNSFLEECENAIGFHGRIIVRKSGTENVIRILVESINENIAKQTIFNIKEKILEMVQ